jgi:hypothetical protein
MAAPKESERLAKRAIEDAGFDVHDANIIFLANCKNIDLVVYGKREAIYVQVKSTERPAGKGNIIVDGSPWTEGQLNGKEPIFNKHCDFEARYIVLVDMTTRSAPEFYVVSPGRLSQLVRRIGRAFAMKPKRDGTPRSIGFRKELPKALLREGLNAWHLLGEPIGRSSPS